MSLHSFLDGVALAAGLAVGGGLGLVIAVVVVVHRFSDGIGIVSLLLASRTPQGEIYRWVRSWLSRPWSACVVGLLLPIPDDVLGAMLAVFAGFFLYIGAAELLPEAHRSDRSRWVVARHAGRRGRDLRVLGLRRRGGRALTGASTGGPPARGGRARHAPAAGSSPMRWQRSAARSRRRSCTSDLRRATRASAGPRCSGRSRRSWPPASPGGSSGTATSTATSPAGRSTITTSPATDAVGWRRSTKATSGRWPNAWRPNSGSRSTTRGSTSTACARCRQPVARRSEGREA